MNQLTKKQRKAATKVVLQPIIQSVKAARSTNNSKARRNRRRRTARLLEAVSDTATCGSDDYMDPFTAKIVDPINDPGEKLSVHRAVQNHFFSDAGNHRGIADGSGLSALMTWNASTVLTGFTATNNVLSFRFTPTIDLTGAVFTGLYWTDVGDPANTTNAGSTQLNMPGPFNATNPSTDYRVVSARIRILPAGAFTSQAGEGKIAYASDLESLGASATVNGSWSRTNVDLLQWGIPDNAVTDVVGNWVPNDYEVKFKGLGYSKNSAIVGYISVPTASATAVEWRVDVKLCVEYLPTATFRPYVSLAPPQMHPNTYWHLNKLCNDMFYPLIVGEYQAWKAYYDDFKGAAGSTMAPNGLASHGFVRTTPSGMGTSLLTNAVNYGLTSAGVGGAGFGAYRNRGRLPGMGVGLRNLPRQAFGSLADAIGSAFLNARY